LYNKTNNGKENIISSIFRDFEFVIGREEHTLNHRKTKWCREYIVLRKTEQEQKFTKFTCRLLIRCMIRGYLFYCS